MSSSVRSKRGTNLRGSPRSLTLVALFAVLSVPAVAQANVGTPLMWASGLHMLFGNACIGVLEGVILAVVFKVPSVRTVPLMILANYFSAWVGWAWLIPQLEGRIQFDLYNTWGWLWKMTAIAYAVTLLFEWPFVAAVFFRTPSWIRRSVSGLLLTQTISYALVFGWYFMASGTSLYSRMSVVPIEDVTLPEDVLVYFLGDRDGDVYCCDLCTRKIEKIRDLHSTHEEDCLLLNGPLGDTWNVTAWLEPGGDEKDEVVVLSDLDDARVPHHRPGQDDWRRGSSAWNFGDVPHLGESGTSPWRFRSGNWPIEGLHGENSRTGAEFRFSLDTPFASWSVRNATQLPDGLVVFQLGRRQICVVDPETKRIALLSFGRGPIAILKTGN